MNIRSIKRRNTRRVKSWIARTRGNITMVLSALQMVRLYGAPCTVTYELPPGVLRDMVWGPETTLGFVRVEETDLSQVVRGTDEVMSGVFISSDRGPA